MQLAFFKACGSDLRPDRGLQRGPAKRCGKPLPGDVSLCERRRCVVVLVGHFVPQQIVVAAWGAKSGKAPKPACGAPRAKGLTANAQPKPPQSPRSTKLIRRCLRQRRWIV